VLPYHLYLYRYFFIDSKDNKPFMNKEVLVQKNKGLTIATPIPLPGPLPTREGNTLVKIV
jgi:hypothetical protein